MENTPVKEQEKTENKTEINCEHDANENIVEDQHEGTIVCSKCGVVVVEQVICGLAEWRNFADDNQTNSWQRSRVGGPANRFLSSGANLTTSIRPANNSSSRNTGDSFNSSILRTVQRKSVDNGIYYGLKKLDEMAERIHLTQSILEYAHYLYYKMYKMGKFKGIALHTDAKVDACLYIACYHAQSPRTINEICSISENDHASIRRSIHRITKMLNLPVGPIECRDVIPRFCAWLSLPHEIERNTISIAETLAKLNTGKKYDVETMTGTAIYFATQRTSTIAHKRTPDKIANCLGISEEQLYECYKFLCRNNSIKLYF